MNYASVIAKRVFDFAAALFGGIFLLTLFLFLSIVLWLSSGSPVLFRQKRVGLNGRDFTLFKFRTMKVPPGNENDMFDVGQISRVTPIGRVLRKTKLDELPQLWNVLRGDMSFVGPRPEVRRWVDACPERWRFIHTVRPGITDPASILFRHEERLLVVAAEPERLYEEVIMPRKLELYEEYVRTQSFLGDLKIIGRTFMAVFRRGQSDSAPRRPKSPDHRVNQDRGIGE